MITEFIILAAILLLIAMAIILLPVFSSRGRKVDMGAERKALNVAGYQQRMSELEEERADERLTQPEFDRLVTELKLALLEDTAGAKSRIASDSSAKLPLVVFAVLLAILAVVMYSKIGAINDAAAANKWQALSAAQQSGNVSPQKLARMTATLQTELKDSDNPGNLYLLSSIYMQQEQYADAAAILKQLVTQMPSDMTVATDYVQAEYLANDRQMTTHLRSVISRILSVDPDQPTLLALLAMDSFSNNDYAEAVGYWKLLQRTAPANSENAALLANTIRYVEGLIAQQEASTGEEVVVLEETTPEISITVSVSLASTVNASPSDTVFVYARAHNGPKMPLAIYKTTVDKLPLQITLDDSMAMMANMSISRFDSVEVVARISPSGQVAPAPGDWESVSEAITPSANSKVVLQLSHQL